MFPALSRTAYSPIGAKRKGHGISRRHTWSTADTVGIPAPIVIFIAVMQRHLIKGLTFGTIKR
jgi:ABC-type glycerol-3-phosphate transport system permease component